MDTNQFGQKIAFLSTYPPKQCGLATFAVDLRACVPGDHGVIAVDDAAREYPPEVGFVIDKFEPSSYREAAIYAGEYFDVVSLQHEYGIFGGPDGEYILDFLGELSVPAVLTCHTVLLEPSENQRRVLSEICRLCDMVMVMSDRASEILESVYGVPYRKIVVIPHGVPDSDGVSPAVEMTVQGTGPKLLTFGLLSPGKGIETAIDAVGRLKKNYPAIRYFVLGATHPELKRREGEAYRDSLLAQVSRLGLDENVVFVDEFVDLDRLCSFLAGADIYVTPYLGKEQIVSGTLSYAVSFGLPIVSTPFTYAEELADKDAAVLFPFRDDERLAGLVDRLLSDFMFRGRLRTTTATLGRTMRWPVVGQRLASCFESVCALRSTSFASVR